MTRKPSDNVSYTTGENTMQHHDITQGLFMKTPQVGQVKTMHIFGKVQQVTILAVHSFGTMDIELSSGKCFRVTGLSFL
jgi:hypothetical protein